MTLQELYNKWSRDSIPDNNKYNDEEYNDDDRASRKVFLTTQ